MPTVHTFPSTGAAYDASQADDTINDGDVLHVPAEGVTGVLYKAWPVAVTPAHGHFHTVAPMFDLRWIDGGAYEASLELALATAKRGR
jgi:hypothetical protein